MTVHMIWAEANGRVVGADGAIPWRLPEDQAMFRTWCLAGSDACSVTLTGRRESAQSTRLSAVTSVHWTRTSAPENEKVARTRDRTPAYEPKRAAMPR